MIKYLLKKKMKKEVEEKGKRALIYGGAVLTGTGMYFSYRAIKNRKLNKDLEEENYLNDNEYEIYNYNKEEKDELGEKVKEFNSRRINYDNCQQVSKHDLEDYVSKSEIYKEEEKKEIDLDENDYEEKGYDKYEYYEDGLSKDN